MIICILRFQFLNFSIGADLLRASVPEMPVLESVALGFQLAVGTLIPFFIIVSSNVWIIITVSNYSELKKLIRER